MYLHTPLHLRRFPAGFSTLEALSWNAFFRAIGEGFLGVFIPVYIFLIGRDLGGPPQGLITVALFTILLRLVVLVFSIPVARLIRTIGFRRSIFLGTVFEAVVFLLLIGGKTNLNLLWLAGFCTGWAVLFYWLPRLSLVSADTAGENMGKSLGILELVQRGSGILAPLAGAVVVTLFGFPALFLVGLLIFLLSSLPMFSMPHHNHLEKPSLAGLVRWTGKKRHLGLVMGFLGRSIDDQVVQWIWPLFVFLLVGSFELLGGLTAAVSFISMFAVFAASLLFDHHRLSLRRLSFFAVFEAAMRLARGFATGVGSLFVLDSLSRVASPFYFIGTDGVMFLAAKEETPLSFFAYREVIYSAGRLVAAGILVLVAASANVWWWMWGMSAVGVILGLGLAIYPRRKE